MTIFEKLNSEEMRNSVKKFLKENPIKMSEEDIYRMYSRALKRAKEEKEMMNNEIHKDLMRREMNIRAMKLKKWYNDLPNEIKQQLYEANASEEFVAIINEMRA